MTHYVAKRLRITHGFLNLCLVEAVYLPASSTCPLHQCTRVRMLKAGAGGMKDTLLIFQGRGGGMKDAFLIFQGRGGGTKDARCISHLSGPGRGGERCTPHLSGPGRGDEFLVDGMCPTQIAVLNCCWTIWGLWCWDVLVAWHGAPEVRFK